MWRFFFIFVVMDGKKTDKETSIESALKDLKKGVSKKETLSRIVKKCQVSTRTAERYYLEAEKRFDKFKKKAAPVIEAKEIEALGEIAKAGILSKLERQQILSEIARGKIKLTKYIVADGFIEERDIVPNWSDRKAAIQELNKMDGAYESEDDGSEFNGFEIEEI